MGTGTGSIDLSTLNNLHTNLTQHFWFNSDAGATYGTGVHMTLSSQAEFIANPTGQNILMNTDGISIRSGLIPLMVLDNNSLDFNVVVDAQQGIYNNIATFGVVTRIGGNSAYSAVIEAGRFGIESGDGVSLFDISPSGNPTSDTYTVRKDIPPNTKTYTLEHTPINGTSIQCNYAYDERSGSGVPIGIGKIMFTAGSFGTKTKTERGTTVTITYSSPQTFIMSVSYSLGNEGFRFFSYKIPGESVDLGILTFGTRRDGSTFGNNSATIGNDLLASRNYQTVVGKSNKDYDGPFVVGNGDAGSYSNAFAVDWYGNVRAKGDIYVNCNSDSSGGTKIREDIGENKVLWSGAWWMNAGQTATLEEKVSEQLTGIVLVWSYYTNDTAQNYGWHTTFIPKAMVQLHNGVGWDIELRRTKNMTFGTKYVYVNDDRIVGHADNVATGTANNVPYKNNQWVLRYVFGC